MSSIGLYDIDMWHRGRSGANLELMKYYNYYNQRGDCVTMMKQGEDYRRYNKVIYFKDNYNIQIPRTLNLNDDPRKEIYGYGFYRKYIPPSKEILDTPLDYSPYDLWSYKLKTYSGKYDTQKENSLIRLETEDFLNYKANRLPIIIVDHNFLYLNNALDFLTEYKQHRFYFYHSLWAKDADTYYKFSRFSSLFSDYIIVDFQYDENFFLDNFHDEKTIFKVGQKENETHLNYLIRMAKIGLLYKKDGIPYKLPFCPPESTPLDSLIIKWIKSNSRKSCLESYPESSNIITGAPAELRIWLKTNPLKIKSQDIDFQSNL